MTWYRFDQNNSGGSFVVNNQIGPIVWIEASSAEDANDRAEGVGIYFNGSKDNGIDCPCCGDRWYPVCKNEGSVKPERAGKRVTRRKGSFVIEGVSSRIHEGITLHLYYKNGTHERIFTKGGKVTGHTRD